MRQVAQKMDAEAYPGFWKKSSENRRGEQKALASLQDFFGAFDAATVRFFAEYGLP